MKKITFIVIMISLLTLLALFFIMLSLIYNETNSGIGNNHLNSTKHLKEFERKQIVPEYVK